MEQLAGHVVALHIPWLLDLMMSRYYQHHDASYRELLVRLSKGDYAAVSLLVAWLRQHGDERGGWIENRIGDKIENPPNKYYPAHAAMDALMVLGIHTCTVACFGCDWPEVKPIPGCRCCNGTGFQHHVDLPPGCGFTVGWSSGLWDDDVDKSVESAAENAQETFRLCYPRSTALTCQCFVVAFWDID